MRERAASPFALLAGYSELIYAENRFTKISVLMGTVLKRSSWRLKT